MTDEQVRTLLPDLLERAAIEEHLADGCNDGSPLEREHLAWAQSLRALAAHLGAGLAEREQAAQDSCGVVAGYGHMMARDLKLELDGGWFLYGFACAEHGLCYWQVNKPGEPMCNQPIWSAPKGYRELHAGDALCCQECGEELGWCCGDVDKVPAFSARQLGCLQPLVERALLDAPLTVVYRLANVLTRCDECGCAMELSAGVEEPVCERCEQAVRDRADAERWRWLDAVVVQKGSVELGRDYGAYWIDADGVYGCCHSDLRGAIDAALEASRDE